MDIHTQHRPHESARDGGRSGPRAQGGATRAQQPSQQQHDQPMGRGQGPPPASQQRPPQGHQPQGGQQSASGTRPPRGQQQMRQDQQMAQGQRYQQPQGQPPQGMGPQGTAMAEQRQGMQTSMEPASEGEIWAVPSVDVFESADAIELLVDVPGARADDIDLRANEESLLLVAEREASSDDDLRPLQRERPTALERTIPLPARANVEGCEASVEDGVCEITLPKREDDQQRRIGVE